MKKIIVANWKMNNDSKEAASFIEELKHLHSDAADVVICPPFTLLNEMNELAKGSKIRIGAQNMHHEDSGAYTGEISPLMLKDSGCQYVIIGHSERREFFHEDGLLINKKIVSALKHSLTPILCVGEDMGQRENKKTEEILENQLRNCLKNIGKDSMPKIIIAYEPVWAISRGNPNHKAATSQDAEEGHKFIRTMLENMFDKATARKTRIIYGGSMKPENAKELLSMPDIDGGLVGNASLDAKSFSEIIKCAEN